MKSLRVLVAVVRVTTDATLTEESENPVIYPESNSVANPKSESPRSGVEVPDVRKGMAALGLRGDDCRFIPQTRRHLGFLAMVVEEAVESERESCVVRYHVAFHFC